jgi:adenylate kinase
LASEIVTHARQELVRRLDGYESENSDLFKKIVEFIDTKAMSVIKRHSLSGMALVNTEDPLFDSPLALSMLIDIFSERGYHAVVDIHRQYIPESIDMATGKIQCLTKKVYRIRIRFAGSEIRRG